jgi:hypothetical protein
MTTWNPPEEQLPPLLQAFRNMSPTRQPNMLALEVFLLCAQAPKTYAELEQLTGCNRPNIEKAVKLLTPRIDPKTGEVNAPAMHLLKLERIKNEQTKRISITARGRRLLDGNA